MATKFEKDEQHLKFAYGSALFNAGFQNIIPTPSDLDDLLADDGDIETFSRYISKQQFEADFVPNFRLTRKKAIKDFGWWEGVDMDKYRVDPQWKDTIRGYFEDPFKLAIKGKK